MARLLGPKCKPCRRLGESVCGTAKCALRRRNTPPGQHGQKGRGRLSGYALQLREKQKAKATYGILERQFRTYFEKAKVKHGKTGEMMLVALESRLDNVLYRAGFASTRRQARQLVSHGQVLLNGNSVDIPSVQAVSGDVLTVKPQKLKSVFWQEQMKNQPNTEAPTWMTIDRPNLSITIAQTPTAEMIQSDLQMNLIIELYSL